MNILVLMAGKGERFSSQGYEKPKPLIEVNGKTILQWTTESCPYIRHDGTGQDENIHLHFAVRQEHLDDGLAQFLYSVYGKGIEIIPFKETTRGSLETACISTKRMLHKHVPLLVLDSDNKYNNNNLVGFINGLPHRPHTMAVSAFTTTEHSVPNKWSNVLLERNEVIEIREKDDTYVELPALIGVFYFADTNFFQNYASYILTYGKPIQFRNSKEYYMSMVPADAAKIRTNARVYCHTVTDVVPLGTPENVEMFRSKL
jgi:NDP-sugar pyrophosphorylase family protein